MGFVGGSLGASDERSSGECLAFAGLGSSRVDARRSYPLRAVRQGSRLVLEAAASRGGDPLARSGPYFLRS
jgi:hypothetical protein